MEYEEPQTEADLVINAAAPNGKELQDRGSKWIKKIEASIEREKPWRDEANKATLVYMGEKDEGGSSLDGIKFNILHSNIETIVPAIYNSTPTPDVRRRFRDNNKTAKDVAQLIERTISASIDNGALDKEIERLAQSSAISGRGIIRVRLEIGESGLQQYEQITFEAVPWQDYVEGASARWDTVPWVAFRHSLSRDDSEKIADRTYLGAQENDYQYAGDIPEDATVWEVWCKRSKKVYFVRADDGFLLREEDDPLGLTGFFPIPEPCQQIEITGRRMPVVPYTIYKELSKELEEITKRIYVITSSLKVRGIAPKGEIFSDLETWADADDNQIVQATGLEAFIATGGADKAISWFPLEPSIKALQQLMQQREQTKQAIYEITGISDIVRGASQASETATAQQIKSNWGSLRIKRMQKRVEYTVRDVFQIMSEIIATKFSAQTLKMMTGIDVTPDMQQLMEGGITRLYMIDVESDSTVRGDVTKAQGEMNSFLQGTSQYLQAIAPAVQSGMLPEEVALQIFVPFTRTFKLGKQVEDVLEQLLEQAKLKTEQAQFESQKPDPAVIEAEARAKYEADKLALEDKKINLDAEYKRFLLEIEAAKLRIEAKSAETRDDQAAADIAFKDRELSLKEASGERSIIEESLRILREPDPEEEGSLSGGRGSD